MLGASGKCMRSVVTVKIYAFGVMLYVQWLKHSFGVCSVVNICVESSTAVDCRCMCHDMRSVVNEIIRDR